MLGLITWYQRESACETWDVFAVQQHLTSCALMHASFCTGQCPLSKTCPRLGGKSPCVLFLWASLLSFNVKFLQTMHLWCSLPLPTPPNFFFHDLLSSWPWTFYLLSPLPPLLSSPVCGPWRADPCAVLPQPPDSLGSVFGGSCHWCPDCCLTSLASLIFPFVLSFLTIWTSPLCPGLSSLRE